MTDPDGACRDLGRGRGKVSLVFGGLGWEVEVWGKGRDELKITIPLAPSFKMGRGGGFEM